MINYSQLTNYLLIVARRHPNLNYCEFKSEQDAQIDPKFYCPSFVISPDTTLSLDNGVIQYGFRLLYLDKVRQEGDNIGEILEAGIQFIIGYTQVINLDYKVISGYSIEPVRVDEGGFQVGTTTTIQIEDQYNLDKYMSVFYG